MKFDCCKILNCEYQNNLCMISHCAPYQAWSTDPEAWETGYKKYLEEKEKNVQS